MKQEEILMAFKEGKLTKAQVKERLGELKKKPGKHPLSEGQKGLWSLQKMSPGLSAYNVPLCFRISRELNLEKFEHACGFLLEQYPVLTTVIGEDQGVPFQTLQPSQPLAFQREDISTLEPHESLGYIKGKMKEPFSLENGPLMRIHLFSRPGKEYIVLITLHHIIFDGSSLLPFIETLLDAYQTLVQGKAPERLPSSTSYHDFVQWEAQMLAGKEGEEYLSYWKQQLSGPLPTLELPTDHPRSANRYFEGHTHTDAISPALTGRLKSAALSHDINLSVLFLGIFKTLLYRYTGQEDIIVGMPFMGRPQERFESLIGYFINMIAIRSQTVGREPFLTFIRQLRLTLVDGLDHAAYPFPVLVRQLNIARTQSYAPVFQVSFAFQNFIQTENLQNFHDRYKNLLPREFVEGLHQEGEFELGLEVFEQNHGFTLNIKYNPHLFDASTIKRMMGHYIKLTQEITADPHALPGEYALLSESEQKKILFDWNDTHAGYPKDQTLVDLFQAQVEKTPGPIAVVFEELALSYRALNTKANRLAHYLMTLGVGAETLVGLFVRRSLEMVTGLLGILKAGGAYVPLDPDYPLSRLRFMLEDASVPVLLSQSHPRERLPVSSEKTVCSDRWWEICTGYPGENPVRKSGPENLAYVIYTSGSTGMPKGVMIGHAAITQHVSNSIIRYRIAPSDNVMQFASLNFDASIEQIFGTWCGGARLVLLSTNLLQAKAIGHIISKEQITIANLPPAYWQQLLHGSNNSIFETFKLLILGGEALSSQLARQTRQILSRDITLLNAYGPTEATITASLFEVTGQFQDDRKEKVTPLGQPIANTRIYILDANHNPTPLGIPGELFIAGAGLARGYLNRPELTAARFVLRHWSFVIARSAKTHDVFYKTGDLARWLPDGNIEFLGRLDHQVKLRGFRIELSEIEVALNRHEAVKEAVVVLYDKKNNPRLVAYVTLAMPIDQVAGILRPWLKTRLPEYMLPSAFTVLDKLPLTPNGKIDRNALPAPDLSIQAEQQTPRTETEHLLCNLWSQVLGIEVTSILSHFFEIGGHSLLATQLVSRIRESFGIEMPLRVVFEQALLREQAQWLDKQQRGLELPPIMPLAEGEPLVLSFAQQRLWFLNRLEGPSVTYNMPGALRLEGPLNRHALEQSLQALVARHESLRTFFPTLDDMPTVQVSAAPFQLGFLDLQTMAREEQEQEIQTLLDKEAQHCFDLEKGPLFRVCLVKSADDSYVLMLNMHHIISDGWSVGLLTREWGTLYKAVNLGQPSPLPSLTVQYTDFAHWQRQWLRGDLLEQQLDYWKQQLAGAPALLELPTDHPRPAVQSYKGAAITFSISAETTTHLYQLSRQSGVTLFMTLLSAYAVLLSRYSGQRDIVIGSSIANRTHSQIEPLVGFFVNTLVMRLDLAGNPSLKELLQQARRMALEAYAHQDLPFEYLVEGLKPERNLGHSPLFQVMFILQNAPMPDLGLPGLRVTPLEPEHRTAKFDLSLFMEETAQGLAGELEYNTDLFESPTIYRMIGHFKTLLPGLAANPQQPVHKLPLLTRAEQQQLLAWNDTTADYPRDKTISDLFEEQVDRTPEAVALVFKEQQLTYRELNIKANQLAHYLRSLGVKPGVLAGLGLARSLEMVIGLMGVLKAGGAYLPLDPAFPAARLTFILEEAQVPVLVTQSSLKEKLAGTKAAMVYLDVEIESLSRSGTKNPANGAGPLNLAYATYTSGSSGKPKGILTPHQGVVNYLAYLGEIYRVNPLDVVLQLASLSFDASVRDLIGPLTRGAQVVLIDHSELTQPGILLSLIRVRQVTCILSLAPSLLNALLEAGRENNLPYGTLRLVLASGEVLPLALCRKAKEVFGQQVLVVNQYGPTESTMTTTYYPVTIPGSDRETALIGRPIPNTRIYILDDELNQVPIGVFGQLSIGGVGLALGYMGRPHLTQEKFIPHPFSKVPHARIYKTGDLGRYLPDGNIEYLGRMDNQVKIRGIRVELGEIEAVLGQHPAVRENVVIVRKTAKTGEQLAAYLVRQQGQDSKGHSRKLRRSDLVDFLKERLPDYMLPAVFVTLAALPLTANGKIDRLKLSQLSPDNDQQFAGTFTAPRTPEEELLEGILVDMLDVRRVGVHDNFFELGVHSLLALRMISRIRDTFAVALPLRVLFESPTIAGLCDYLENARRESPLPPITQVDRSKPLPLSFAQQRLWFLNQLEGPSATYNMPGGLRLEGPLNRHALEQSLQALVARHESLRTVFSILDGAPVVRISETPFQVDFHDFQALAPKEQELTIQRIINREADHVFDLEKGPLFCAALLQLGPGSHILVFNMHHIISDGWSSGVLTREWGTLYPAFLLGEPSPLPPLPIQYVDFAHWQRQWLQGEVLQQQTDYWKQKLAGAPALLELPTDRPRPDIQRFRGASLSFSIPVELTTRLRQLSRQCGATLFMTLLSAYAILLFRYTGQSDIVIGSPTANRTHSQIEDLVGFFVNTLVLRLDLAGNPTFEELLQQARRTSLDAYAHQDIPFEYLVEKLKPERNLGYSPLFQVMFTLQNTPFPTLELEELSLTPLEPEHRFAKFDLSLSMTETTQGLSGELEYNTDLFESSTPGRMIGHLKTLLAGLAEIPRQSIHRLPLLTEPEQQQFLSWNQRAADYPFDKTVIDLFAQQVDKTPGAIVALFEDQTLTYGELHKNANGLSHYLLSLGVKTDVLVGICLDRHLEMVVALLGILKTGGAYLPLEPDSPEKRLAFVLDDAQPPVLITSSRFVEKLPKTRGQIVCLDAGTEKLSRCSADNPIKYAGPDNLAYVIFTSGSTGRPKGVCIIHGALVNFLISMRHQPGLVERDILLAVTTISFDIAALELFLPLLTGCKIRLASRETAADGPRLLKLLNNSGATVMQATPATWRLLLTSGWQAAPGLKILCGGEALPGELAAQLLERGDTVWNMYGPTETTIWSAVGQVKYPNSNNDTAGRDSIEPIGPPIANTRIYILDRHLHPVPLGIPGELTIGGHGLALGYLNRPELTAEKFIPDPFSGEPGVKIYKTGDLARFLPDRKIDFLGRIDHQVKIRGYRIELGEIEAVLMKHPVIGEAVVNHYEAGGNKCLGAWFTLDSKQRPGDGQQPPAGSANGSLVDELRDYLKEILPRYMLPTAFVQLETMPLTFNGKIDRKALPAPDAPASTNQAVARDVVELQLRRIWEKVLHVRPIGLDDNFFDLGGHSLLSIKLMSHIEQLFAYELPLTALFQAPTIAKLAERIRKQENLRPWSSSLVPIQTQGPAIPLFCLPGAGGMVIYFFQLSSYLGDQQPVYGLQSPGLDGKTTPHTHVEDLATHHLEHIKAVQPRGPYLFCGHSFGSLVAYEIAQQLLIEGEEIALLAVFDTAAPGVTYKNTLDFTSWDDAQWYAFIAKFIGQMLHKSMDLSPEKLRQQPAEEQFPYFKHCLRQAGLVAPGTDALQLRGFVEVFKADSLARYQPENTLPIPVALFQAEDEEPLTDEPGMGWPRFAHGPVSVQNVPGNHVTMMTEPHVKILAEHLKDCLNKVQKQIETRKRQN